MSLSEKELEKFILTTLACPTCNPFGSSNTWIDNCCPECGGCRRVAITERQRRIDRNIYRAISILVTPEVFLALILLVVMIVLKMLGVAI